MTKVFICGDIVNYGHEDGRICSDALADVIAGADYAICNFEAPVEGNWEPTPKLGPKHYQRKGTISGLKQQGFDLLCLANNHIMDFGTEALTATLQEADRCELETIGAGHDFDEAYQPVIKTINDMKIGMINACEAQFSVLDYEAEKDQAGYAWINHRWIDRQIVELKQTCDAVIVLAHAGLENYNIPQKEWRERYRHFCDLGADAVVGSHPHVPQGYEHYQDSIIFYSLGNFYFDSKNYRDKEDRSYAVMLEVNKEGKVSFEPVYHHKQDGRVQLSPEDKQIDLKQLNQMLGDDYLALHAQMSLEAYEKTVESNLIYSLVPIPYDGRWKSSAKKFINTVLGRRKNVDKSLLSLHLIRNETYHYATKHALELKAKEKYDWR